METRPVLMHQACCDRWLLKSTSMRSRLRDCMPVCRVIAILHPDLFDACSQPPLQAHTALITDVPGLFAGTLLQAVSRVRPLRCAAPPRDQGA